MDLLVQFRQVIRSIDPHTLEPEDRLALVELLRRCLSAVTDDSAA